MMGSYHVCDAGLDFFFFLVSFWRLVLVWFWGVLFVCLGIFNLLTPFISGVFCVFRVHNWLIAFIFIIQVSNMPPIIFCRNKEILPEQMFSVLC